MPYCDRSNDASESDSPEGDAVAGWHSVVAMIVFLPGQCSRPLASSTANEQLYPAGDGRKTAAAKRLPQLPTATHTLRSIDRIPKRQPAAHWTAGWRRG